MLLEKLQVNNINQKKSSELVVLDLKALLYPHHHLYLCSDMSVRRPGATALE